jgi:hypothetical protein
MAGKIDALAGQIKTLNDVLLRQAEAQERANKAQETDAKLKKIAAKQNNALAESLNKASDGTVFASKKLAFLYDSLTATNDEFKLFGVRAKTVRKVVYGFLPPGAFRLVNKFSTSLLAVNSVQKSLTGTLEEGEEVQNNIFTTLYRGYKATLGFNRIEAAARREKRKDLIKEREELEKREQFLKEAAAKRTAIEHQLNVAKGGPAKFTERVARSDKEMKKYNLALQDAKDKTEKQRNRLAAAAQKGPIKRSFGGQMRMETQKEFMIRIGKFSDKIDELVENEKKLEKARDDAKFKEKEVQETQENWQKRMDRLQDELSQAADIEEVLMEQRDSSRQAAMMLEMQTNIFKGTFGRISKFLEFAGRFLVHALKFIFVSLFTFGIVLATILFLKSYIEDAFNRFYEKFPLLDALFTFVSESVPLLFSNLYDFFTAIVSGDLETMIDSLLHFVVNSLVIVLGGAVGIITALIGTVFTAAYNFIFNYATKSLENGTKVLAIMAAFVILWKSWAYFDRLKGTPAYQLAIGVVLIGYLFKKLSNLAKGMSFFKSGKSVRGRSTGGIVGEDITLVGERGPELVSLPRGSRVHTNRQSKNMVRNGGNVINVTVNANGTNEGEIRKIANKVANIINREINRSTSSSMSR